MIKKWKNKSKKSIFKAKVFDYYQIENFSPESQKQGVFDLLQCRNWVNVIAITPKREVIMVEQYRHGTDRVTLEIPGGVAENGKDILSEARRELAEETGYQSEKWESLGQVDANPAFMNNFCATFLAQDCLIFGNQNLDPLEEIEIRLIPLGQIPSLIQEGKITHSLVVAAFYLYGIH